MKLLQFISVGTAAALCVSTAALAFQEQQGGAIAPQSVPGQGAQPGVAPAGKGLGLGEVTAPSKPSGGTEVRIPGLGKLGVLPKMDFGLELLYGAADQQKSTNTVPDSPNDDLMIRGSVKHRF